VFHAPVPDERVRQAKQAADIMGSCFLSAFGLQRAAV
jgi:hypothetical protein